jgi:hypothetical protein
MERLENDMDDLFRKAGELYPLKITESDWDGVAGKLQEAKFGDEQTMPGANSIGTGNKRRWLFLLFLIPLALAGLIYTSGSARKHPGSPAPVIVRNTPLPTAGSVAKGSPAKQVELVNRVKRNQSPDIKILQASTVKLQASATGFSDNLQAKHAAIHKVNYVKSGDPESTASNENPDPSLFAEESFQSQLAKPLSLTTVSNTETISVHGISLTGSAAETAGVSKNVKANPAAKSANGFYAGFLVGPDMSAVKFQSVKQLGFSLGARVGYRFNKRLSVETGLLWDKKYYYSKGEYFDKSEAGLQFDILSLEGTCNMFEIPLTVRYDFSTHTNHNFFVKGGISSYLMKKENYSYNADGVYGPWQGDSTYYNSTNNIFSIVQISAGYDLAVGRKTKISFEPYVKIPLHGIGIGGMPISSAGLYIGITHSFR